MYRFKINMLTNSDAIIEILAAQNTDSGFPPSFRSKYANGKAAQSTLPTIIFERRICPVA